MSLQAHSGKQGASPATFVSQRETDAATNVTKSPKSSEEIRDFFLAAGDKIDLSDVASYFRMTPDEVREALYFSELSRGTEVGIEFDGIPFPIVVVHGVTAAALCKEAPWVFSAEEIAAIPYTRDGAPTHTQKRSDEGHVGATDEFVFDKTVAFTPPQGVVVPAKPADIAQLALALGLSETQILDALRERGFSPTGDPAADAEAASAALSGADALVL